MSVQQSCCAAVHMFHITQDRHGLHAQGCTIRSPILACTTSQFLAANTATRPAWTPRRRLSRAPACCLAHDRWYDTAYQQVALFTAGPPSSMMCGCRAGSGEADKLKAAMERHKQVYAILPSSACPRPIEC